MSIRGCGQRITQGSLRGGNLRGFFWIHQQDSWWPHKSCLGGEVGPEARLNVVGWGVCVNAFHSQALNQDVLQEKPIGNPNYRKSKSYRSCSSEETPFLNLFYESYVTSTVKPDTEKIRVESSKHIAFISMDTKTLSKILANSMHHYIEKIIHHQGRFIPGIYWCFNVIKSMIVIYYIRVKNPTFDTFRHPFITAQ